MFEIIFFRNFRHAFISTTDACFNAKCWYSQLWVEGSNVLPVLYHQFVFNTGTAFAIEITKGTSENWAGRHYFFDNIMKMVSPKFDFARVELNVLSSHNFLPSLFPFLIMSHVALVLSIVSTFFKHRTKLTACTLHNRSGKVCRACNVAKLGASFQMSEAFIGKPQIRLSHGKRFSWNSAPTREADASLILSSSVLKREKWTSF